jgi:uridine phosphorylase
MLAKFDRETFKHGISVTAPGFYAPQGRRVRARPMEPKFLQILQQFSADGKKLTNIEMETAGLYGLSRLLGHRAISCSVVLANRLDNTFSADPAADVRRLITAVLEKAV